MADLDWRVVPIERWPGDQTQERVEARFKAGWSEGRGRMRTGTSTVDLLAKELEQLGAENILLQMAVERKDIRLDGWIRANARPDHPGVILTFDSHHGPLSYPCDTFADWQANVRAIALALEALRKVDRYGVSRRGEQYRGWGQLPPAGGSSSTLTAEAAARVLVEAVGWDTDECGEDVQDVLDFEGNFRTYYRDAARRTHPDAGGSTRDFQLVQEAKRVLERHHGGRA